jgi:hypothetical protein
MSGRPPNPIPASSVPGTERHAFDSIAHPFRENPKSAFSVPGTEAYVVEKAAGGAAE